MEEKKISFGFSKTAKKTSLQAGPAASVSQKKPDSKQFIECVEENSIKTVGPTEEIAGPLVIPLRDKDKNTIPNRLAKLKIIKQEKLKRQTFKDTTLANSTTEIASAPPNETGGQQTDRKSTQKYPVVPLLPEERLVHLGLESTLDDYERVPVEDFGIAMLRGMGYKEDAKKADGKGDQLHMVQPHPQGIGLDVDLSIRAKAENAPLIPPAPDEELVMKIGARVRVVNGRHQNKYGTIKSMEEGTCLIFVKFALDETLEWVNHYWLIPVSMEEHKEYSKVLNSPDRTTISKDHERLEDSRSLPGESESVDHRKKRIHPSKECSSKESISTEIVDPKRKRLSHTQKSDEPLANSSTKLTPVVSKETIDQRAIREIIEASQQRNDGSNEQSNVVVSLIPEDLPLEGAQESTLDDYERVAVKDVGMAMLRGMGLKEDAKKADETRGVGDIESAKRPVGIGLGYDRSTLLKAQNVPLVPPAPDEVLVMKIGARVRVVDGRHQNRYGTVISIEEDTSRVMVKFTLGGINDWVNEYMVMLVSNEEYTKYSKVLNATKYEELNYREKSDKRSLDSADTATTNSKKDHQRPGPSRSPPRGSESSARWRNRTSSKREASSEESTSGSEDDDKVHKKKKQKKGSPSSASYVRTSSGIQTAITSHKYKQRHNDHRRHGSDSESDDRHHKKKTKKSKKPRSRSRSRR